MNIGIYHTVVHSLPTQLTCSFVNHRQHCSVVRLTCKVYGKGWILTPNDIKIPEIFEIWTWRPWLRPGVLHQCKFSFQSVQWFCDFFPSWLYCIFFLGTHPGRTCGWIFMIYGSHDMFSPKDGPFGGCGNIGIHLGVISPKKLSKGGMNVNSKTANFKPNRAIIKIAISCKV